MQTDNTRSTAAGSTRFSLLVVPALLLLIGSLLATPAVAVVVNVGGGLPSGMEIEDVADGAANKTTDDADTDATGVSFDWDDILDGTHPAPYSHTQLLGGTSYTFNSYGIVQSVFNTDDTADGSGCVGGDEDGFGGGAKIHDNPFDVITTDPNSKADSCSGGSALEIIQQINNDTGEDQVHYVLFNYWTRDEGATGDMTTYQILRGAMDYNPDTPAAGPGDPEYRCDDFLVEFNFEPSGNIVTVASLTWKPDGTGAPPYTNAECSGPGEWQLYDSDFDGNPGPDVGGGVGNFGPNVDPVDTGAPGANEGTFGESGVDLTALGVLPEDGPCSTFRSEGSITRTGNSDSGSTIDVLTFDPPLLISNCTDVEISKAGNAPGLDDFEYVLYQEDGMTVHDAVGSLVEANGDGVDTDTSVYSITSLINIDDTHLWQGVISEPDYLLDETTIPADWELGSVVCTYYDPFAQVTRVDTILPETVDGPWDQAGGPSDPDTFEIPPDAANNDIITACEISNVTSGLIVEKIIVQGDSGTATLDEFNVSVGGTEVAWTTPGSTTGGVEQVTTATGTFTLSEDDLPGYAEGAWSCMDALGAPVSVTNEGAFGGADVIVDEGDVVACSITNEKLPSLTLVKTVTNDNGGDLGQADFPSFIDGNPAAWDIAHELMAGVQYTVSETPQTGYTAGDWGGDCATDGTITLLPGELATCTITNDDVAPMLTLVKTVTNDDGGDLTQADFPSFIDGSPVAWDTATAVTANSVHTATETPQDGYTPSAWGTDCAADGTITLLPGESKTCSITNDDVAPTLTLVKTVTNDNGGNLAQADFPSFIDGSPVAWDTATPVTANAVHTASETPQDGYTPSAWGTDCAADGTITLLPGENKTCAITNDDVAPSLTLLKDVTNDDGGDAVPSSFVLRLNGSAHASGDTPVVAANLAYTVGEDPLDGYTLTEVICEDDNTQESLGNPVTLGVGQSATCTVYNDDIPPQLTVVKSVINDDGGTLTAADFTLHLTGNDGQAGTCGQDGSADYDSGAIPTPIFANCPYTLSEDPVNGYNVVGVECLIDGTETIVGHPVTLNEGQNVTCTITNDDAPPGLTLLKSVTNDDGGMAMAADFTLRLTGGDYVGTEAFVSGDNPPVLGGVAYTVSEDPMDGYTMTGVVCMDTDEQVEVAHPVTLTEGQSVTCTISNDDDQPYLTLVKAVITDDGGSAANTAWTLTATGAPTISGVSGAVPVTGAEVNAGSFTLVEADGPDGYTQTSLVCAGNETALAGNVLTIALGEDVTCTFTNDDVAPMFTLIKSVTNDDGGTAVADDFLLTVGGTGVLSGVSNEYMANTPLAINETLLTGYEFVSITGDEECPEALGGTVTLVEGDDVTCTITNDDIAPMLTLVKVVQGGMALPDDFLLTVGGAAVVSGESNEFAVSVPLAINETLLPNYSFVSITGDAKCPAALGGTVSLDLGDDITCTLTNLYRPPIEEPVIPVPVNNPLALFLLTLMMLAGGWYYRPTTVRRHR